MNAFLLELGLQDLDLHLEIETVVLFENVLLFDENPLDRLEHMSEVVGQLRARHIDLLLAVFTYDITRAIEIGDEEAPGAPEIAWVLLDLGEYPPALRRQSASDAL